MLKGFWFVPKGAWWGPLPGFVALIFVLIGWWGDVIKESRAGDHTPVVDIGLRYGMILFIASEVMFFVAWFWMFFELAIFHEHRGAGDGCRTWDNRALDAAAWAQLAAAARARRSIPSTCR